MGTEPRLRLGPSVGCVVRKVRSAIEIDKTRCDLERALLVTEKIPATYLSCTYSTAAD